MSRRKIRKMMCGMMAAVMVTGVAPLPGSVGIPGNSPVIVAEAASKKPSLSRTKVSVDFGKKASISLDRAKGKVKWSVVKGKDIVSVKKTGKKSCSIIPLRVGSAVVEASSSGKSYKCKVKVRKVSSPKIKKSKVTLKGKDAKYTIKYKGRKTKSKVTFESSNTGVAKVSKKGVIRPVSSGSCYVYAWVDGVKLGTKVIVRGVGKPETLPSGGDNSGTEGTGQTEPMKPDVPTQTEPIQTETSSETEAIPPQSETTPSQTEESEETEVTEDEYTFTVSAFGKKMKGGDSASISVDSSDPNKVKNTDLRFSSDCLELVDSIMGSGRVYYSIIARKVGVCQVDIYYKNILKGSYVYTVTSDDENYKVYTAWKSMVKTSLGDKWTSESLTPIEKLVNVGQFLLDNYNYASYNVFWVEGGGDCECSTFVLRDFARDLGLKNFGHMDNLGSAGHVNAGVYYNGTLYCIEAGFEGTAGDRGRAVSYFCTKSEHTHPSEDSLYI